MKAQGMSIGVVITAALAVMVLLMVGGFMSGGFSAMTGKITSFVGAGPSAEDTSAIAACNSACTTWKSAGCPVKTKATSEGDTTLIFEPVATQSSYFKSVVAKCCTTAAGVAETPFTGKALGSTITCGACSCADVGKGGGWGQ